MRLKSEFWIKAYIRRRLSHGHFAAVVRHGDDDAGAIYVKINKLDGTVTLFGPAPSGLDDSGGGDRTWMRMHAATTISDAEADALIAKAFTFDSDLWLIEVEDRAGQHSFTETELPNETSQTT
jgi:hypothetical protein